jgi:alkylation response protein AidB-like acyl-CoA dehydrogenase
MSHAFSQNVLRLRTIAEEVTQRDIAPRAAAVDRDRLWPEHSFRALAEAGLLGLNVPADLGGSGEGLSALAAVTEVIGTACGSSAICFGMHCVATAVIAAKPTDAQKEEYLRPIASGRHITTLALSEPGSGANFYLPATAATLDGDTFSLRGRKHFVTNGGHADSYVVSTQAATHSEGEFNCIIIDAETPGMRWSGDWSGMGMRGNSAITMELEGARVPQGKLLGQEGDQIWYVFEVVAPFFLVAMAGTYLGLAQAALDYALAHVKTRFHGHTGDPIANIMTVQHRLGYLWSRLESARQLLYSAAALGDEGSPSALVALLSSKAEISDAAVTTVNEAMTLCGGIGYRDEGLLDRLMRDIRASHVMAPTTDMLRIWSGRALLGQPLL